MGVTGHPIRQPQNDTIRSPRQSTITRAATLFTGILALVATHLVINVIIQWGQIKLDDLRYGRPRTTHLTAFVGHNESNGQPTHMIALNLQRQIVVLELPGGDARAVRSLPGPYLFGNDEALTPVLMSLRDIDQDQMPDLLVKVRNEQIVYLNKDGAFRLPTPEEQARLVQEHDP